MTGPTETDERGVARRAAITAIATMLVHHTYDYIAPMGEARADAEAILDAPMVDEALRAFYAGTAP
jgi:hypothetical protein